MSAKVKQILLDRITDQLDNGIIPWIKPWNVAFPRNAQSKRNYSGFNVLVLGAGNWLTMNQIRKLGGTLKRKHCGVPIAFYKNVEKKDKVTNEVTYYRILRYYLVFNVADVEGLPEQYYDTGEVVLPDFKPIDECEKVIAGVKGLDLRNGGDGRCCYNKSAHYVSMPPRESFHSEADFYASLFHEVIHWTMKDLNRDLGYADEELVAEIGANLLLGLCGIERSIENSAAYCAGWASRIRKDEVNLLGAAAKAQKAVDYILGKGETHP